MILNNKTVSCVFFLAITLLVGCAGVHQPTGSGLSPVDAAACVGQVDAPPEGLVKISDSELLQSAIGESGAGKLCQGQVFSASLPVIVYRVWNSNKTYTRYGRWWSFQPPLPPKSEYRKNNGVCPSWSPLDRLIVCRIKVDTKIVVGPGQSAKCANFTYPKSATNQVFIPNDTQNNILLVENCSAGENWP